MKRIKTKLNVITRRALLDCLDFLFRKESPEKKTSIKNKLKVNSNLFLDYRFVPLVLFISILSISNIILSGFAYADNLDYNVVVKPSLKITLSSTNPSLNLNPTNHAFDSTNITSTVSTNHPNGYKLYISTAEGSGGTSGAELVNTTNSTYTIPTLPSTETGYDATTFPANYWGYKLDTTSTEYLPYSSNTLINQDTTATNGTESTITFAAKIDYNKPAGLYNLTFDLKTIPIVTQTYMQDMSNPTIANQVCKTESPSIVIDSRDEQAYMIQRLDDGKCWMLDNLNLDLTNRDVVNALTAANTNINLEQDPYALESLKNGARDKGNKYATTGLTYENWDGDPQYLYSTPLMNKGGSCGDSCVYTNNTILSTLISNSTFGLGSGKIGIFYNYCAATVGSYCYGNSASTGIGVDNATSDVCPANWKLTSLEDFSTLCSILNNNTCSNDTVMDANDSNFIQYKLSTPLSGDRNGLGVYQQGVYAAFWTSTIDTYKNMRQVRFYQNKVNVTTANYRGMGQSVRCLLQE